MHHYQKKDRQLGRSFAGLALRIRYRLFFLASSKAPAPASNNKIEAGSGTGWKLNSIAIRVIMGSSMRTEANIPEYLTIYSNPITIFVEMIFTEETFCNHSDSLLPL